VDLVCHCQQVLSKSVGEAFAYYGDSDTAETKKLVRIFNKLFHVMNVKYMKEDILNDLRPFRKANDLRLKVTISTQLY